MAPVPWVVTLALAIEVAAPAVPMRPAADVPLIPSLALKVTETLLTVTAPAPVTPIKPAELAAPVMALTSTSFRLMLSIAAAALTEAIKHLKHLLQSKRLYSKSVQKHSSF